jgi:POT family proton-dependent oligopeptide transporter
MAGKFPGQVAYIVTNEACERFSYYGMLSILSIYLAKPMRLGEDRATEVVHLFATAVYFLPILGGWIADRWLGRYRTILSLSLFYCLGHGALALYEGKLWGIYLGLGLIALGAGGIKPCVSAFVGDQFPDQDEKSLRKVYGLFYWSINIGAFFGFAVIPRFRDAAGYSWAFALPGIFMGIATLVFWLGRRRYVIAPSARAAVQPRSKTNMVDTLKLVGRIALIFLPIPIFWSLFNQVNSTWVFQGSRMQPFHILGYKVDAESMQSVGALLVLMWVPVLTFGVYPLAERFGLRPTPLRRIGVGLFLAALAYLVCAAIQMSIDQGQRLNPPGQKLSIAWQVLPYIILEAGEVMVSATALEFAFSQAPASLKSTIMSLWLMTIAGGHFLVAAFTNLNARFFNAKGAAEFLFYAGLMFVGIAMFVWVATRYRPQEERGAIAVPASAS